MEMMKMKEQAEEKTGESRPVPPGLVFLGNVFQASKFLVQVERMPDRFREVIFRALGMEFKRLPTEQKKAVRHTLDFVLGACEESEIQIFP